MEICYDSVEVESNRLRCEKNEIGVSRQLESIDSPGRLKYAIHHYNPSPVVDFPKNVKSGEGKEKKREEYKEDGRGGVRG